MKDKYYTPSIEEFRVGFECEIQSSYGWQKNIWPDVLREDSLAYQESIDKDILIATQNATFRVKYLNKEDIESLGFKLKEKNDFTWTKGYNDPRKFDNIVDIIWDKNSAHVLITVGTNETTYEDWKTLFTGTIKNISELKIILKQVGITNGTK